jgi:phosphatidylinositol glycan class B
MPTLTRLLSSTSPNSRVPFSDYLILLREGLLCGSFVLLVTAVSDRLYFGEWTFPPYQWLYFNVSQDLAVFYGRNDWHYYLTQGLPLLLTTYLPFALVGLWESTSGHGLRFLFATVIFTMIGSLSLISHKEVRFIYPLLPLLHLITAPTLASFFYTTTTTVHPPASPSTSKTSTIIVARRKLLLGLMLILNLGISGYTTFYQQSGVISATKFLRSEYEALALDSRGVPLSSPDANKYEFEGAPKITDFDDRETFAAFLMPCHSTPWRSQLIYPGLKAWALTCEPPLGMAKDSEERARYRDEADRFYDDPVGFLKREVNTKERPWPRYVVGFEGVEDVLREYYESEMKGFKVRERWRAANSHWHDDWRRKGDVVVWEFVDGSKMEESE